MSVIMLSEANPPRFLGLLLDEISARFLASKVTPLSDRILRKRDANEKKSLQRFEPATQRKSSFTEREASYTSGQAQQKQKFFYKKAASCSPGPKFFFPLSFGQPQAPLSNSTPYSFKKKTFPFCFFLGLHPPPAPIPGLSPSRVAIPGLVPLPSSCRMMRDSIPVSGFSPLPFSFLVRQE